MAVEVVADMRRAPTLPASLLLVQASQLRWETEGQDPRVTVETVAHLASAP